MRIAENFQILAADAEVIQKIALPDQVDLRISFSVKNNVIQGQKRKTGAELFRVFADPLQDPLHLAVISGEKNRDFACFAKIKCP